MKVEIIVAAVAKIFKEIEEPCISECRDLSEADKLRRWGAIGFPFGQTK